MEPGTMIAIGALIISFLSLIFTAKTYRKNARLEFVQRRDLLSQKISFESLGDVAENRDFTSLSHEMEMPMAE